jgi:hypothetical protein
MAGIIDGSSFVLKIENAESFREIAIPEQEQVAGENNLSRLMRCVFLRGLLALTLPRIEC